ncbi:MAG: gluconeogenesis factor YvcK family protein [Acidimicrobiia bacterium]
MGDARTGDGPAVVAIGGGHGLAVTLQAAMRYARRLTAVVSVADDGGSSGRLRASFGLPAVGDLRRCLSALADPGRPLARAFERRLRGGALDGHALGNLVVAALAVEAGSLGVAVDEAASLLGVGARVVPATEAMVELYAGTATGEVRGQVAVQRSVGIERVWLEPRDAPAPDAAVAAIAGADQVVIGPGSLFTSVLAALAVPGVAQALAATPASRVYVCNLDPQEPETAGYGATDHVRALASHEVIVDVVLCDGAASRDGTARDGEAGEVPAPAGAPTWVRRPVARPDGRAHDPRRLAVALAAVAAAHRRRPAPPPGPSRAGTGAGPAPAGHLLR